MQTELKAGVLLGTLIVVGAAWYFFGRERANDVWVSPGDISGDQAAGDDPVSSPAVLASDSQSQATPLTRVTPEPSSTPAASKTEADEVEAVLAQLEQLEPELPAVAEDVPDQEDPESAMVREILANAIKANRKVVLPDVDPGRQTSPTDLSDGDDGNTVVVASSGQVSPTRSVRIAAGRDSLDEQNGSVPGPPLAARLAISPTPTPTVRRTVATVPSTDLTPVSTQRDHQVSSPSSVEPTSRGKVNEAKPAWTEHIIEPNESLAMLAEKHYGNQRYVSTLLKANPGIKNPNRIFVGQKIRIPAEAEKQPVISSRSTSSSVRSRRNTTNSEPTYRVRSGDTLYGLAAKHYGDGKKWRALLKVNRDLVGNRGRNLRAGQLIRLPKQLP